jgi:glycine oxidase
MDIGIVGAGLLGRLLAWRLARAGHAVTVFDPAPDERARGAAGWTAAGMLSPLAELECANADVAALGWRSLALWPQWLGELAKPVHFAQRGSLLVAHAADRGSADRLLTRIAAQVQHPERQPQPLDVAALRALEPAFARGLLAWQLAGEGQIHTVQAMHALTEAASACGVQWVWGRRVERVEPGRIDRSGFDLAIDVRGLGAKGALPVRGVRGEILWVHAPGVPLAHPVRLLHPRHRVYLVPRPDDLIVVGASEIETEDLSPISVRSTVELLAAAASVLPELAEARVVHTEVNLRPALPDNLPHVERHEGLVRINGLYRHGWLIAPALVEQAIEVLPS